MYFITVDISIRFVDTAAWRLGLWVEGDQVAGVALERVKSEEQVYRLLFVQYVWKKSKRARAKWMGARMYFVSHALLSGQKSQIPVLFASKNSRRYVSLLNVLKSTLYAEYSENTRLKLIHQKEHKT